MKTNAKRKNSAVKKLVPAAGMLALSASMLATSTYAWFTMNKEVEVTGLTMKTKVSSNLLISSNNAQGSYISDRMSEERKALLEPVSSVSGKTGTFFYTLDADELGNKGHKDLTVAANQYKPYSEATNTNATATSAGKYFYDDAFSKAYGVTPTANEYGTAYGYIDYVFYLKATGNADNQELRMTACDLNYTDKVNGSDYNGTGDDAWRIAVFASDITSNGGKGNTGDGASIGQLDPAASNPKAILKTSGSTGYFTEDKAVASASSLGYVNVNGGTDTAAYGSAVIDNDIDSGVEKYYKVLIRVWLEGEDKSCKSSTYAQLTNNWSLDVEFKLVDSGSTAEGETTVTNITKNTFTPSIAETQTAVTSPVDVVTTANT